MPAGCEIKIRELSGGYSKCLSIFYMSTLVLGVVSPTGNNTYEASSFRSLYTIQT